MKNNDVVDNQRIAEIFKALGDETRVAIIKLLQEEAKCACQIGEVLQLSKSKLSYHMKILCESGIVEGCCRGKWTHYHLNPAGCLYVESLLSRLTHPKTQAHASISSVQAAI